MLFPVLFVVIISFCLYSYTRHWIEAGFSLGLVHIHPFLILCEPTTQSNGELYQYGCRFIDDLILKTIEVKTLFSTYFARTIHTLNRYQHGKWIARIKWKHFRITSIMFKSDDSTLGLSTLCIFLREFFLDLIEYASSRNTLSQKKKVSIPLISQYCEWRLILQYVFDVDTPQ